MAAGAYAVRLVPYVVSYAAFVALFGNGWFFGRWPTKRF